jgi:hypothetical protein
MTALGPVPLGADEVSVDDEVGASSFSDMFNDGMKVLGQRMKRVVQKLFKGKSDERHGVYITTRSDTCLADCSRRGYPFE